MNRTEFLKTCAGGLCGCAAIGLLAPGTLPATETPKPEDWRFQFIKQRYAKLLENLAGRVGDQTLDEILHEQGRYCASTLPLIQQHKGDIDGFIQEFKQRANEDVTYDRTKGVITVVGPERGDCFCPLIDCKYTPKTACNCSLGWQQYVYETLLGKKVQVELKESVLHGGKRCIFEIHVSDVAAA
jgi:predicted ArsR family transcriptional regulator